MILKNEGKNPQCLSPKTLTRIEKKIIMWRLIFSNAVIVD